MATFQHRIAELRENRGLSHAQMAEQIGISEQRYKDYEQGPIHANTVERLGILVMLDFSAEEAREIVNLPDSLGGDELFKGMAEPRFPFVELRDGVIEVIDRGSSGMRYPIAADRIASPESVMRWIEHLSGKTWVTKQHIREFVRICSDHLGTSLHPCG